MNVVLVVIAMIMQHVQTPLEVIIAHARSAIQATTPPVKVRQYLYNNISRIFTVAQNMCCPPSNTISPSTKRFRIFHYDKKLVFYWHSKN